MICYKIVLKTEEPHTFTSLNEFKNHQLIYHPHIPTHPIFGKIFAFETLEDAQRMVRNMSEDFRQRTSIFTAISYGETYRNCCSLPSTTKYEDIVEFWRRVESGEECPANFLHDSCWYDVPIGTIYVDGIVIKEQI